MQVIFLNYMYVLQFFLSFIERHKTKKKSWTCGMKQNKFNGNVYYEALKSQQNNAIIQI